MRRVEVILWHGRCEVHERFTAEEVRASRRGQQDLMVLAHPECPPEMLAEAGFVGSTAGMIRFVSDQRPA